MTALSLPLSYSLSDSLSLSLSLSLRVCVGMYYLRTKAAVDAIKFTVDAKAAEAAAVAGEKTTVDSGEANAPPECISCGA